MMACKVSLRPLNSVVLAVDVFLLCTERKERSVSDRAG